MNIAARIEPLAEPGGICLSEDVERQIRNKIDHPLSDLGRGELKNITLPVHLYRVVLPWESSRWGFPTRWKVWFRRHALLTIGATIAVSVLLMSLLFWPPEQPHSSAGRHRIAVMPLDHIGAGQGEDYFSEGMTEEFISSLSKIRGLSVIARSSVLKYRGAHLNIMRVGTDLAVGTVLGGSIRKSGNRIRLSIRLIDVATGEILWSEDYDREVRDILAVQTDIAMQVATNLKVELLDSDARLLARKDPMDPGAHTAYLLGRYHLNKRTNEDNLKAIGYFDEALRVDPSYALAHVGLAECYTLIGGAGYSGLAPQEAVHRAKTAAMQAIALDSLLPEAHAILGYVKFRLEWDWREPEQRFERSIELQPGYAKAHEWYALYLALRGQPERAIPMMKRALDLDPLSSSVQTGLGRFYSFNAQHEEAIRQFQKALDLDPNYAEAHFGLSLTFTYLGRYDNAIAEVRKAIDLSGRRHIMLAHLGYLFAKKGQREKAFEILNEFESLSKTGYVSPYPRAVIYFGLGDTEQAMDFLEKALEQREGLMSGCLDCHEIRDRIGLNSVGQEDDLVHIEPLYRDVLTQWSPVQIGKLTQLLARDDPKIHRKARMPHF